jgi:hypothetical protein
MSPNPGWEGRNGNVEGWTGGLSLEIQHGFKTIDSKHVWGVVPEMENYSRESPIGVVENEEEPIVKRMQVSEAACGVENQGSQIIGASELKCVIERWMRNVVAIVDDPAGVD